MKESEDFNFTQKKVAKAEALYKNIAGCIDAIAILFLYLISFVTRISFFIPLADSYKILYIFALFIVYRLVIILITGRTIGMYLLGMTFLKEDQTALNTTEKLCAALMVYLNGIDCYATKKHTIF